AGACGVVGLKPTYGLVSRRGVFPLAFTLDHVGPMARSVADTALLLDVLAGHDPADPGSVATPARRFGADLGRRVRGLTLRTLPPSPRAPRPPRPRGRRAAGRGAPRPRGRGRARPRRRPAAALRLLGRPARRHARRVVGHPRRLAARASGRLQRLVAAQADER